MKIKLVIALYNLTTPPENPEGEGTVIHGSLGTVVFKKEADWNLPFELKEKLQLGVLPGYGPLVVSQVRNDGTLEEPHVTVECEYRVFEDDLTGYRRAVEMLRDNGFEYGKAFVDTKSMVLIFPSKSLKRMKV